MKKVVGVIIVILFTNQPTFALTLAETFRETVSNSPDILTTEKDHLAIQEALKQAKAGFLPQLKVTLGYGFDTTRNSDTLVAATGPTATMPKREEGVTLNQMLFDGFATKGDVARNVARVNSATYKVLSTIEDTVQRDVEVYLGVLREEELVKLAQQNLAFHENIIHMINLRTQSGVSRLADLYQANARLSLAKSNLLAEYSNLGDARANFFRTIGLTPNGLVAPNPPNPHYIPNTLDEALAIALKNNPVIKSADADIYAAIEQHNIARAVNFPRFDLQLGATRNRNDGGIRGPDYDQYAMIRMSYTLFNGGADVSRQHETAYQHQEAKEVKARAVRQLIEAVKLTWDLLVTARKQLVFLKSHQNDSISTVQAYAKEYQIGQRTLLDLLDSQNELFGAKRSYISGQYDLLQAEYRILRDMGLSIAALNLDETLANRDFAMAGKDVTMNVSKKPEMRSITPAPVNMLPIKQPIKQPEKQPVMTIVKTRTVLPTVKKTATWAVQLGSFKNKKNAMRLVDKLQAAGYPSFMHHARNNIMSVYVGPQSEQASAEKVAKQLNQRTHLHSIVVTY